MRNQLRLLRDVSGLVLMAVTWRLWFSASDFPAVPFLSVLTGVPRNVDCMLSVGLMTALLIDAVVSTVQLAGRGSSARLAQVGRASDLVFALTAGMLALLNQHCLQPWMYHLLLLTPLLWQPSSDARSTDYLERTADAGSLENCSDGRRQMILWLTASIYGWSAWSKLDAGFLESHGPKFVHAICEIVGIATTFWSDRIWWTAAAALPMGELLVGLTLLFRRFRSVGLVASLVMHVLLILAVGPWGLNHRAGVLLWNGFFVAQNVLLLMAVWRTDRSDDSLGGETPAVPPMPGPVECLTRYRIASLVVVGAILFPAFRTVGYCDTWPAWAVYASSPARMLVQVRDDSVSALPQPLQGYIEPHGISDGWSWLRIDQWCLAATGTPLYPEDRFHLGVALFVAKPADLRGRIRIICEEEADRWTGERERSVRTGKSEMTAFSDRFLLNSSPREKRHRSGVPME